MRMLFGLLLFYSQSLIIFTSCCIPSPALFLQPQLHCCCIALSCLISANTAVWLMAVSCMCVCLGHGVISSKFCLASFWERKKTWEDLESGHPCLMPPALEELLFPCPASCWSSWAPAVPLGGRRHRSGSISACRPTAGSFLRQHW